MQLKNIITNKLIKIGSTVEYGGDKCLVYQIKQNNIGLERISDGVSWDLISAESIGCIWVNKPEETKFDKLEKIKKNKKYTHVKIQGKWLRADIIHIYPNSHPLNKKRGESVWYQLENNQGCGWVDEKYRVKVK